MQKIKLMILIIKLRKKLINLNLKNIFIVAVNLKQTFKRVLIIS